MSRLVLKAFLFSSFLFLLIFLSPTVFKIYNAYADVCCSNTTNCGSWGSQVCSYPGPTLPPTDTTGCFIGSYNYDQTQSCSVSSCPIRCVFTGVASDFCVDSTGTHPQYTAQSASSCTTRRTCTSNNWACPNGTTCGSTTGACVGSAPPTPTPTPACTPGSGSTTASCGGTSSACICNGTTCQTQGYYCSAGSCVNGWAGGTTCAQSSCNGGAGCSGATCNPGPFCNGTTCQTQGWYTSGGNQVCGWAGGTVQPQSSCNGGAGCLGGSGITCQQCVSGSCSSYTYTGGSTCPTNCSLCSGSTCRLPNTNLNPGNG